MKKMENRLKLGELVRKQEEAEDTIEAGKVGMIRKI